MKLKKYVFIVLILFLTSCSHKEIKIDERLANSKRYLQAQLSGPDVGLGFQSFKDVYNHLLKCDIESLKQTNIVSAKFVEKRNRLYLFWVGENLRVDAILLSSRDDTYAHIIPLSPEDLAIQRMCNLDRISCSTLIELIDVDIEQVKNGNITLIRNNKVISDPFSFPEPYIVQWPTVYDSKKTDGKTTTYSLSKGNQTVFWTINNEDIESEQPSNESATGGSTVGANSTREQREGEREGRVNSGSQGDQAKK